MASYEAQVKKLLNLAGIPDTPGAREELEFTFQQAQVYHDDLEIRRLKPVPPKAFEEVVAAVDRLRAALNKACRHVRPHEPPTMWLVEGEPWGEEGPCEITLGETATRTASHIARVLRHVREKAQTYSALYRRKPGQPKQDGKLEVVVHALWFLEENPPEPRRRLLSRERDRFAELFFETVTGRAVERGALAYQIQSAPKIVAARKARRASLAAETDIPF
jgi:hypothetical protein